MNGKVLIFTTNLANSTCHCGLPRGQGASQMSPPAAEVRGTPQDRARPSPPNKEKKFSLPWLMVTDADSKLSIKNMTDVSIW